MVQFASYLRRVLCKTRLIFPRINGPTDSIARHCVFFFVVAIQFHDTIGQDLLRSSMNLFLVRVERGLIVKRLELGNKL